MVLEERKVFVSSQRRRSEVETETLYPRKPVGFTDTLELALRASGCDQIGVNHKPRPFFAIVQRQS
jgi:hypothetical protein